MIHIAMRAFDTDKLQMKGAIYTKKVAELKELTPDQVARTVMERNMQLKEARKEILERYNNAPEGTLRISERGDTKQYYHRTEPFDTQGKYIKKQNKELAQRLAQKDYDKRVLKEIQQEISLMEKFLHDYHADGIMNTYEALHHSRKELILPLILDDKEYVERWKSVEYPKMRFDDKAPEYYTDAGERVRSKSEIIIANKLKNMNIPYRYEFPILVSPYREVHPDFYCLNVRTRKEFVWEHFGMVDDPDYAKNMVRKIEGYEMAGFWPGINMITTFETMERPLNVRMLEKIIETYLI